MFFQGRLKTIMLLLLHCLVERLRDFVFGPLKKKKRISSCGHFVLYIWIFGFGVCFHFEFFISCFILKPLSLHTSCLCPVSCSCDSLHLMGFTCVQLLCSVSVLWVSVSSVQVCLCFLIMSLLPVLLCFCPWLQSQVLSVLMETLGLNLCEKSQNYLCWSPSVLGSRKWPKM